MAETQDDALAALEEEVRLLGEVVSTIRTVRPPHALETRRLVSDLTREWERVHHRRLSSLIVDEDKEVRREIPILSPEQVLARWRSEGAGWVRDCSRLDLRALINAARHQTVGPLLLAESTFWPSLKARLRDRQADHVLNVGYFIAGNLSWIEEAIRSRAQIAPTEVPPWWVNPGPIAGPLASAVARMARSATYGEVLGQLGLPDVLPDSFLTAVARASQATQAVELAALRTFLDRGVEMGSRAVIFDSTREWVRRATQIGTRFPQERLTVAELLRGRIGDLATGRDEARWTGLENERRTVRTWLIGEIFRVLFSHLVPDGESRRQTEPRRKFWSHYDQSVEKIWLLICDDHRDRLNGDEAVTKLKMHGILEVLRFTGQPEQDALWMQLRSSRGEPVTILEGNANMPIRIWQGSLLPPISSQGTFRSVMRVVDYHQARSMFPESDWLRPIIHRGDWQSRTEKTLKDLSVNKRGDR